MGTDYRLPQERPSNCQSIKDLSAYGYAKKSKIEEFIDGYTTIPKFARIGFEIVVFTFFKSKTKYGKPEEREKSAARTVDWLMRQPNVIFAICGQGMGWDGIRISFHKSYSDFARFARRHESELSDLISESQSFIADISPETVLKPFHFKYLAKVE
ncbi:MAG: hypothetical protein QHH24_01180 [Candidatus Bathyarchaeota archaeon]|nr:hypothetical protein [Candidatus Bathyarchaeota archaeon]